MKIKVIEVLRDQKFHHYELDKKGWFFWRRVGEYAPLAGGDCIGTCAADYTPRFQAKQFKSMAEVDAYIFEEPCDQTERVVSVTEVE